MDSNPRSMRNDFKLLCENTNQCAGANHGLLTIVRLR